jgi:predicted extracellular nuclease
MSTLLIAARAGFVLGLVGVVVLLAGALPATAKPDGSAIVISQVYGGGGNVSATYTHDFIELFNPTSSPQSLNGWSVQYTSASGSALFGGNAGLITDLPNVTLAPGQYYLIQEASQAAVGSPLPTPDLTDSTPILMAANAGKVALVSGTTSLGCNGGSFPCNADQLARIVDLVGYGTGAADFFEGTGPAPTISNTTSDSRASGGCTDTDDNAADFTTATPNPRNTASTVKTCLSITPSLSINDVSHAEGNSGTTTFTFNVSLSAAAGAGGVTFDIATQDGTATTSDNDYTARSLTSQTIPAGSSAYTFDVDVNGDTATEPNETFLVNATNVTGANVADGQGQGTIVNDDVNEDPCSLGFTPIPQIQGSGPNAAITGNVTTQGVVVGDFEGTAANSGFFIQDPTGDGDPATSDGIFVFTGSSNLVSPGELVRVTGFARERFSQTAINGSNSNTAPVTNVVDCGTGTVLPTDVTLPFATADFAERYEGMLTRFPQPLVISEYFNYDRFGEIVLANPLPGEPRPFTGTAIDAPGAAANARTLANSLNRITLDDNQSAQNPVVLRHPNGDPFSLANLFRGGDTVQNAVGVLGFDFSLYRIYPTGPADYTAANPRPAAPEPVGGTIRVAAMNTLNFFVTADYPTGDPLDNKCGPAQNVECRGWDSDQPLEFTRQRDKLLTALSGLNGDIIGLNELENTTGTEPLDSIVSGLPGYDYIHTGPIGTDAIKVGVIYRPAVVTPVGPYKLLTSAVDPRFIDTKNRPSLAQTFAVNATGARFTVVVNHLKSKGSDCNDVGDPDLGDGQGNCSQTRRAAAKALVDWLATDPTGTGDPDFLIMGDLNSYAMEDTLTELQAGADDTAGTSDDFTNLIATFQGPFAYSYTFDGQAGYLDHALANASLLGQVTRAADWHINSDEPDVLDYDTSFKPPAQEALYEANPYRTSDHDPVVVGLTPTNSAPTANAGGPYSVVEGGTVTLSATGTDPDGDTLTYAWDLDGDGAFEKSGQSVTFSASGLDGPSSRTVKVRATDPGGLAGVASATVNVLNGPPVATAPVSQTATAGFAKSFSLGSFTDPYAADGPWTVVVEWGDGSPTTSFRRSSTGSLGTQSHTFTRTGTFTVNVVVTDKDGASGTATFQVTVVVTYASLCNLSRAYSDDPSVADSLCSMLRQAEVAPDPAVLLDSFRKLVIAQSGKALTSREAAILTQLSLDLQT